MNDWQSILEFLRGTVMLAVPLLIVWGWVRWAKDKQPRTFFSKLSLIGFLLATASAVLAMVTWVLAPMRSVPFYDPVFLRIYRAGLLLSLAGVAAALIGIWRRGPLRWHAPSCAVGTLFFWFMAVEGE